LINKYSKIIFTLYYKVAYNAAYFYCGDKYIAEEAAQEAILKAIQNIHQLRDPNKIEPWIKKIAINNTITLFRKHKKVLSLENSLPISDSPDNLPEYFIDSQETLNAVRMAIDSLNPVMKQVIYLRFYEEMKIKDISLMLKKPENTIRTIIHRGKISIKKKLISEGYLELKEGGIK
jgi:RNA polymerase sigma-70 factor (ECF subfamily)